MPLHLACSDTTGSSWHPKITKCHNIKCMYVWMNVWMNVCMYVYQYIIFYLVQTIARTSLCNSPSRPGCPVSTAKEVGSVLVEPVEAKEVVCASSRKSKRDSRLTGLRHIYIYIHIIYIYIYTQIYKYIHIITMGCHGMYAWDMGPRFPIVT